ncbi:hypothetical protein BU15DRAFT_68103 [Melanogaster broomeanus]|nr:hypothetical protein BU15DRAFT_68103 [Melanogaster broomeanus]
MTTGTRVHTFCYECIVEAVQHSPQRPIDRSTLSMDDLTPANPIVKHACLIPHAPQSCTESWMNSLWSALSGAPAVLTHVNSSCTVPTTRHVNVRPDMRAPEVPQSSIFPLTPNSSVCLGETKACQLHRWGANVNLHSAPAFLTGCHLVYWILEVTPMRMTRTMFAHPSAITIDLACLVAVLMSVWLAQRGTWGNSARLPHPPGPRGLPLIVTLLSINVKEPLVAYMDWAKMYVPRSGHCGHQFREIARVLGDEWGNTSAHKRKLPLYGM